MLTYAVVQIGPRQYRAEENGFLEVERFTLPEKKKITLDKVLFVQDGDGGRIGQPYVANASVSCEIDAEFRGRKVISFKFKKRKNYRRKKGSRREMVRLRIKKIQTG